MIPPLNLARSQQIAAECDLMLVIGTSAMVQPAAMMPVIAKEDGAMVIEINPETTPLSRSISDTIVMGEAGDVMRRIVAQVERSSRASADRNEPATAGVGNHGHPHAPLPRRQHRRCGSPGGRPQIAR